MVVPVKFSDIGKSVSDLIKPDYSPFSLEVNSQTVNGVKFTAAVKKPDSTQPELTGDLKAKYFDVQNGVTFNYSFNTDRKLVAKAEIADTLVKGLKVDAEASIKAEKDGVSSKGIKFGFGFKQDLVHANASIDVLNSKIPVSADVVLGFEGLNFGTEISYSVAANALTGYTVAASYNQPDYAVAVHASPDSNSKGKLDISKLTVSYYHQLNNHLGAGAKLTYVLPTANTHLTVGSSYAIDAASSIKGTLDTTGKLGLQYTQKLRPGVKATFGTSLNLAPASITADTGVSFVFDI
jgi:voltage-dependent anion channel protein 2